MARALIHMPESARRGEVIEIRALIGHPMETGYRPGADGRVLPRNIIRRFTCRYNGEQVFTAELHPAIAANPYIAFHTIATESGTLEFTWEGDNGFRANRAEGIGGKRRMMGSMAIAPIVPSAAAFMLVAAFIAPTSIALAAEGPQPRKSGADFMSESTRAMQRDDTQNPAMLWVGDGEAQWRRKAGASDKACADCHADAQQTMRGVAARYPQFDREAAQVVTLGQRINVCRDRRQQAPVFKPESDELLGLVSYVALQSRGMPMAPADDHRTRATADEGRALYFQRFGQLNLSCAQCHDNHWGRKLAGAPIPQAYANAYPIYRLEWQGMGSLQRRLRNCMSGVRAEVPPFDAQDLVRLEAYLAVRAEGMSMEAPGVRP